MNRVRPHITEKEAHCPCGCGLMPGDETLDWINEFIDYCEFSIPISCTARCEKYNQKIGGVKDSPHLLVENGFGAADLKCRDPLKRMNMICAAIDSFRRGMINQIEVCDRHIHIAQVPLNHRLAYCFNWGKSK